MVTGSYDKARRAELAAFLRNRRERVTPADVGIAPGARRRTPGLRREEVAQLAGVGVTWYTWLEQGREINASPQVLDAIARTLRTTSRTLGLITFGVRAIEKQTEPLSPVLHDINEALEQVAAALGVPPAEPRVTERSVEAVEHGAPRQVSGGGS